METANHLVEGAGNNYGDWLSVGATTPIDVICTGYYAYSCDLLSKMAEAIGETEDAAAYLVEDIKNKNWHLSTGFMGVAYLCPMLTEMGYADVAYRLLLQDSYPSWFYNYAAGIKYDEKACGYKHFKVEPYPGGGLSFVNSFYESVHGTIESN